MGSSAATMPFTALLERVDHTSVVIISMIVRGGSLEFSFLKYPCGRAA
jgi:hypothetical protein